MPAESIRFHRRIRPRDRWFVALVACATLVGTPTAVLLSSESSGAGAGCVTTIRASVMGGATFKYCGADAVAFCRQSGAGDKGTASQCEALGTRSER